MRGFLWILPSFLGVMVFYLLPYADVVRRSFLGAVDNHFVGIENYKTVLGNTAFQLAVKNTFLFTLLCIPVLIVVALFCAVTLYKSKYGGIIKSAFLMPMALPAVSVALVWRLLFHSQGLLNHWLSDMNIAGNDWMNSGSAFWILFISYLWKNLGYDIVLWMAAYPRTSTRRPGWTAREKCSVFSILRCRTSNHRSIQSRFCPFSILLRCFGKRTWLPAIIRTRVSI